MKKAVFLDIAQFSLVAVYIHRPENEGGKQLLNVGKLLQARGATSQKRFFSPQLLVN
jgi:hypothetical protein